LLILLLISCLAGCDREEPISFYQAPKDPPPTVAPAAESAGAAALHWDVPAGWKALPAREMRVASFAVNDATPPVELTVIPLGPESGEVLPNVNRWEKQLGLPETPQANLEQVVKHVSMNGLQGDVVDFTAPPTSNPRQRMLAAMVPSAGKVWFFKLVGPVDVVTAQKANFDAFIASLHPGHGAEPSADEPVAAESPPAAPLPEAPPLPSPAGSNGAAPSQPISQLMGYKAPQGWTEIPDSKPPRMLAFNIGSGAGEKSAEVTIIRLGAHNAGSFQANVTRWRGQIGLGPEPNPQATPMKDVTVGKDGEGILLDFHNPDNARRLLVIIASAHGDLWFIKLTGAAAVVDAQRGNFLTFAKSLEFSGEGKAK
jgi:hypothetical protein